jgi:hypothetical protein
MRKPYLMKIYWKETCDNEIWLKTSVITNISVQILKLFHKISCFPSSFKNEKI